MRRHRIWLAALMIMLILPLTPATGQDNARMSANIVVNADIGWPTRVVVEGYNPQKKAWLGV
ncbi:hypothetical protein GF324_08830, partial [bacterium]|nr:hypothetical protein [bacterium]